MHFALESRSPCSVFPSRSRQETTISKYHGLDTKKLDGEWREHVFEEKLDADLKWEEYWLIVKDAKI